jgi:hypothetical protein
MRYEKPQTCYVRARTVEVKSDKLGDDISFTRILPDIPAALQNEIAGRIKIHEYEDGTALWSLMFHWPTHDYMQDAIAEALKKLDKGTVWAGREALPTTAITVKESVPDMEKPAKDGVQPTKVVDVTRTVKEQASKFGFVGEARAVAVDVKPVEAEGNFVK